MGDGALDLCGSERFREYIRQFRRSHPLDADLAHKYGFLADIGDADSMTQSTRGTFPIGGTA